MYLRHAFSERVHELYVVDGTCEKRQFTEHNGFKPCAQKCLSYCCKFELGIFPRTCFLVYFVSIHYDKFH